MTTALNTLGPGILESLVVNGDLSNLSPEQRVDYYKYRCDQAQLDPAAKPFDLLKLNGKLILYANAGGTQQLTANRKLTVSILARERVESVYCVHVRVSDPEGRYTENMGAVPVDNLKGESLANAYMKATTKAIRRTVLAHCGLGLMDETEVATIPGAEPVEAPRAPTKAVKTLPPAKDEPKVDGPFDEFVNAIEELRRVTIGMNEKTRKRLIDSCIESNNIDVVREETDKVKSVLPGAGFAEMTPPDRAKDDRPEVDEFVTSVCGEKPIDTNQYEALGALLEAHGINRDAFRTYCSQRDKLLPAKKPTLARLKEAEFIKLRDALANPKSAASIVRTINAIPPVAV